MTIKCLGTVTPLSCGLTSSTRGQTRVDFTASLKEVRYLKWKYTFFHGVGMKRREIYLHWRGTHTLPVSPAPYAALLKLPGHLEMWSRSPVEEVTLFFSGSSEPVWTFFIEENLSSWLCLFFCLYFWRSTLCSPAWKPDCEVYSGIFEVIERKNEKVSLKDSSAEDPPPPTPPCVFLDLWSTGSDGVMTTTHLMRSTGRRIAELI